MNLIKLEIIELLEKHKKVTAVADALGLKQPTVTFHMKKMEQEFGVQLFESSCGRILLKDAGKSLLHYAVKINSLAREASRVVKEYECLERGSLKVGASYVPGTYILPGIFSDFSKKYPHVSLSLSVKPTSVVQKMLQNHEIDIGFFSTEAFSSPKLISEIVCDDELVVIFPPDHELACYSHIDPVQLTHYSFILHGQESNTRQMTDKWAKSYGVEFRKHMELDSLEVIKQMVIKGGGVSIISRLTILNELERGVLHCCPLNLQNSFKRHVYFAIHMDRYRSPLVERFITHLHDAKEQL
ncbi:DNA-binding transcriptional LysR family regulator [Sporomusaceae bacterium BoRhaA]|uniref:LysR substrate-binding domain-containing protein n=1 Tax=Pelorhabdus rhamnosifermentans TaxID=2772457 RepID=UPI001C06234B|nr:LysR substrate-binding domain-containing protein [Pelorhabdus rhamnosifermentans]MBU2703545.1 DNA-binding transcriptional LysR family regulator [Pelorhabdus rhamnosifermentans]